MCYSKNLPKKNIPSLTLFKIVINSIYGPNLHAESVVHPAVLPLVPQPP